MMVVPLLNKVLVELADTDNKEVEGIILSDFGPKHGLVRDIGPDVDGIMLGDQVLLPKNGGIDVDSDNKKCIILEEKEIIAIYK